jgi:hypothetical protein
MYFWEISAGGSVRLHGKNRRKDLQAEGRGHENFMATAPDTTPVFFSQRSGNDTRTAAIAIFPF